MWRMLLVGAFVAVEAFALDIDSLPVWNPEILVRGVEPVAQDSAGTQSRLDWPFLLGELTEKQQKVLIYEIIVVNLQPKCRNNQFVISCACRLHVLLDYG